MRPIGKFSTHSSRYSPLLIAHRRLTSVAPEHGALAPRRSKIDRLCLFNQHYLLRAYCCFTDPDGTILQLYEYVLGDEKTFHEVKAEAQA